MKVSVFNNSQSNSMRAYGQSAGTSPCNCVLVFMLVSVSLREDMPAFLSICPALWLFVSVSVTPAVSIWLSPPSISEYVIMKNEEVRDNMQFTHKGLAVTTEDVNSCRLRPSHYLINCI